MSTTHGIKWIFSRDTRDTIGDARWWKTDHVSFFLSLFFGKEYRKLFCHMRFVVESYRSRFCFSFSYSNSGETRITYISIPRVLVLIGKTRQNTFHAKSLAVLWTVCGARASKQPLNTTKSWFCVRKIHFVLGIEYARKMLMSSWLVARGPWTKTIN